MTVEVVIPYAGACQHRAEALDWVRDRYPWPVTVAPGPVPWSKGAAVAPVLAAAAADVVVIADADVWTDGIGQAVDEVLAGAGWAIPHRGVHRLTEKATAQVLAGADWTGLELEQRPYLGVEGGGIIVAPTSVLRTIPLDPRFTGWGQEDAAWGAALRCLLGPPVRVREPLVHLWHPPQQRATRRRGSAAGWRLWQRYESAATDPAAMRSLLNEIPCSPSC
jgi:hypothetical protein